MDPMLLEYIYKYLAMVERVCNDLLKHYSFSNKLEFLRNRGALPYTAVINGRTYIFHGSGCLVDSDDLFVNWDFCGGETRWCNIDPYFVAQTISKNSFADSQKYTGQAIEAACEKAVESGEMIKIAQNCYYFAAKP